MLWSVYLPLNFLAALTAGRDISLVQDSEDAKSYKDYHLFRVFPKGHDQISAVKSLVETKSYDGHLTFWAKHFNRNSNESSAADLLSAPQIINEVEDYLRKNEISYRIIIQDLQKMIESENPPMDPEEEDLEVRGGHRLTWTRYHRYKDIDSYMDYLANTYTDICEAQVIGKSSQGRDLKVLKISTGGYGKPAIWIDGGIHAREWISPATTTFILLKLVEFREQHSEILDSIDWYIMPMANPDGYEYSHLKDRLWRKTRSSTGHVRKNGKETCYGVDPNRNWDFHWGEEKKTGPCSDNFAGPHAFSEPETRAMSDFIIAHKDKIKVYLTLHSYSQMWLIPWGYKEQKPKDYYNMYLLAEKGVDALEVVRGTDYLLGTAAELLYTSSGGSDDWAKGVAGIKYSYSIELPDTGTYGFVLPASQIEPVGQETWAAIKAIATHFAEGHS